MPKNLIWSAINISEGRRVNVLTDLADRLERIGRAHLADWSADTDHNRSVFSLVGSGPDLLESLRAIFAWAATTIDLREHAGEHPRLGAIDVVPFAPLGDTTMDEARAAARLCAESIAAEFALPIFLYRESSVSKAFPLTLPFLRKGGLGNLAARLLSGELRNDFGPAAPHPTFGVSVFGARPPLVAYNCVLDTSDLVLGRAIANLVRESGGGLPGLQALAFPLANRGGAVQISMNLIDPATTPPHLAFLKVSEEAEKLGASVVSSELIGLVPQQSLRAAFQHFLKLDSLSPDQVAESNLILGEL